MDPRFWNERFAAEGYVYGTEPNDFLREVANRIPEGPVLCLAEGEGRNAVFLATLGHDVTAVDFAEEGLRKAEALARERNVSITTVHADLETYPEPPPESFAGVVAIFAHVPPAARTRAFGWVQRILKKGGVFILEAYRPEQIPLGTGGPKNPAYMVTLESMRQELGAMKFDILRNADREIWEGNLHGGPSATVQCLAIRE